MTFFCVIIGCGNETTLVGNNPQAESKQRNSDLDATLGREQPKPEPVVEEQPKPETVVEEQPKPEPVVEEQSEPEIVVEEQSEPEIVVEEQSEPETALPITPCKSGESLIDGKCIQSKFTECIKFVELENLVTIPSVERNGTCYYKKIINELATIPSTQSGLDRATDVLAASHGGNTTGHPWIIGDFTSNLYFDIQDTEKKRTLSLSGNFAGDIDTLIDFPVKIDNFVLVEIKSQDGTTRLARGTGDSVPKDSFIKVDGEDVTDFISYAGGGVAVIQDTVSFSDSLPTNKNLEIRIRMLDAGGTASASDLYMIIH